MRAICSVVFTFYIFKTTKASIPWGIPSDASWNWQHSQNSRSQSTGMHKSEAVGEGPWNLQNIFANTPPGAYLDFIKPLLYANYLTYKTTPGPRRDVFFNPKTATITEEYSGGRHWERFHQAENDPEVAGPFMRAFIDRNARRVILAFRGKCFDERNPTCQIDMHIGENGNPNFNDYLEMASAQIINAKDHLANASSDYAILVTGHAFGAELASWACKRSLVKCQVVGLAGGIKAHGPPLKDSFLLYDWLDLGVPSMRRNYNVIGLKTLCVYDIPPPKVCIECMKRSPVYRGDNGFLEYQRCRNLEPIPFGHWETLCKEATNSLDHWIRDFIPRDKHASPILPNCREFSEDSFRGVPMLLQNKSRALA